MKKNRKGFTLIELLVVVAVIGILASVVLLGLANVRVRGRDARRVTDLQQIRNGLEVYFNTCNHYPPDLNHIVDSQSDCNGNQTGIVQVPRDPTGATYGYCLESAVQYTLGAQLEDLANPVLQQQDLVVFPCDPGVGVDSTGIPIPNECDNGTNDTGVYCLTL